MCSKSLGPYLNGQGHTRLLTVMVYMHMSALLLIYELKLRRKIYLSFWTALFKLFKNVNLRLNSVQVVKLYLIYQTSKINIDKMQECGTVSYLFISEIPYSL